MRDNIRLIIGGKEKQEGTGGPFHQETKEFTPTRIDLRWSNGYRSNIPYGHVHQVEYSPKNTEGKEVVVIYCPSFSRVAIVGRNLSPIYDAIFDQTLVWVRDSFTNESGSGDSPFVELIVHVPLTDWEASFEAMESQREALLGSRKFSQTDNNA